MRPNTVKNCDFMSIRYSKHLRDIEKPTFEIADRLRFPKYDFFCKGYKQQFTREVFEIVAIATTKPPTYTLMDEQDEIIQDKFYQESRIKSFNNGFAYIRVGF